MENAGTTHTLLARLDAEPDAAEQKINHDFSQAETEAFGRRTRPFPNFYHTEVLVTSAGRGVLSSFSHSGGFVFGNKLHRHMDEVVDLNVRMLARFLSKWTGLKTAVLDHTIGRFQSDAQLFAFYSTGVIIGFRQDVKGLFGKGFMDKKGIHEAIHKTLGNPEFWKDIERNNNGNDPHGINDTRLIDVVGSIKLDGIAYSYNRDGVKYLSEGYKRDQNGRVIPSTLMTSKDGKVEKVIDSTALETKISHSLAGPTKALSEPGRPAPVFEISGPSRDVK